MNNGFETKVSFARFNYLVDVSRDNVPAIKWKFLPQEERNMYLEEAEIAEYVITEDDCDNFENLLIDKSS